MGAKREFRNRPAAEVDILDALVDRGDGMTVLELRSVVDADIDRIEEALADLKDDRLIRIEERGTRLEIHPAERVVPEPGEKTEQDTGLFDAVRERLGL